MTYNLSLIYINLYREMKQPRRVLLLNVYFSLDNSQLIWNDTNNDLYTDIIKRHHLDVQMIIKKGWLKRALNKVDTVRTFKMCQQAMGYMATLQCPLKSSKNKIFTCNFHKWKNRTFYVRNKLLLNFPIRWYLNSIYLLEYFNDVK